MTCKQIVFTKPNTAELLDVPICDPKAGEVQIRLVRSAISSGTERANLVGELHIAAYSILKEVTFPRTSGYSS